MWCKCSQILSALRVSFPKPLWILPLLFLASHGFFHGGQGKVFNTGSVFDHSLSVLCETSLWCPVVGSVVLTVTTRWWHCVLFYCHGPRGFRFLKTFNRSLRSCITVNMWASSRLLLIRRRQSRLLLNENSWELNKPKWSEVCVWNCCMQWVACMLTALTQKVLETH